MPAVSKVWHRWRNGPALRRVGSQRGRSLARTLGTLSRWCGSARGAVRLAGMRGRHREDVAEERRLAAIGHLLQGPIDGHPFDGVVLAVVPGEVAADGVHEVEVDGLAKEHAIAGELVLNRARKAVDLHHQPGFLLDLAARRLRRCLLGERCALGGAQSPDAKRCTSTMS